MSYFIIKNNIKINNKKNKKTNGVKFNDLKKYMNFIKSNYKFNNVLNDVNEIIEISSQLHLKDKIFFCDLDISNTINNHITICVNNYDTILTDKMNSNINSKFNLILRINDILDNAKIEYIYNLLQMYNEIIIYNCFITNLNSYRIYVVCLENTSNINYSKHKIPYSFLLLIKNLYYQIIQNRFNTIKKQTNQEKNLTLWKNMYLN